MKIDKARTSSAAAAPKAKSKARAPAAPKEGAVKPASAGWAPKAARATSRAAAPVKTEANASKVVASWSRDWAAHTPSMSAAEKAKFKQFTARVNQTQLENFFAEAPGNQKLYEQTKATKGEAAAQKLIRRGEHEKGLYGTANATIKVVDDLPPELQFGPFKPGAELRTAVRFSHGPAARNISDEESTHPGVALRMTDDQGHTQDMLLSTGSSGFVAKDGIAAVVALEAQAALAKGGKGAALLAMEKGLVKERGLIEGTKEAVRLIKDAGEQNHAGVSLAEAEFFSKVPYQIGGQAVKFRLVPADPPKHAPIKGFDGMRDELRGRLADGPVKYKLQAQGYTDPKGTPMDDARAVWKSPYVTIAELTLPKNADPKQFERDLTGVNDLSFSPFNRWDKSDESMKPLGKVNEMREKVYESSQAFRGSGTQKTKMCPMGFA